MIVMIVRLIMMKTRMMMMTSRVSFKPILNIALSWWSVSVSRLTFDKPKNRLIRLIRLIN